MKFPKKRIIKVEIWDCGKGHHHQTEAVAARCALAIRNLEDIRRKANERALEALQLRRSGWGSRRLAERYKVSTARIQQIIRRGVMIENGLIAGGALTRRA